MQKLRYLVEDLKLARKALMVWSDNKEAIDTVAFYRSSANSIYVYEEDNKVYYERMKPEEQITIEEVVAEIDFIDYLNENDFNAVKPVKTKRDDRFHLVSQKSYVVLFEEAKGIRLDQMELDQDIALRLGSYLGKLHVLAIEYNQIYQRKNYRDLLESFETNNPLILKEIEDIKSQIIDLDLIFGLIHYDFDLDNIFYDADKKQFELIDFDDCLYGYYMHDVMIALKSLDEKFHQSFLEGYHKVYQLETYDPTKLELLERFDKLYTYFRLKYAISDVPDFEPLWMVDLIEDFMQKMNDYEASLSQK